jgi:hypothetical protein
MCSFSDSISEKVMENDGRGKEAYLVIIGVCG